MSAKLKIFTFNLRTCAKVDGINDFCNREGRILDTINSYSPDIIGFQEANDYIRRWLINNLSSEYTLVGCGRNADYSGEAMMIAFKKHDFETISLDTRWLSATPSIPGSTFGGDQSGCPRLFTAVVLKHKEASKPFLFLNTHLDHKGKTARLLGAVEVVQYISDKKLPFIITGDMNAYPDTAEIAAFVASKPCGREVIDATSELGGTFHGFGTRENKIKIDYIFTDMPCDKSESFIIPDESVDGVYISDHHPVCSYIVAE